jgi:hypothetical protein
VAGFRDLSAPEQGINRELLKKACKFQDGMALALFFKIKGSINRELAGKVAGSGH